MPRELCGHWIKGDPERPCARGKDHKGRSHRDQAYLIEDRRSVAARRSGRARSHVPPRSQVMVGGQYREMLRELAEEDRVSMACELRRIIGWTKLVRDMARGKNAD